MMIYEFDVISSNQIDKDIITVFDLIVRVEPYSITTNQNLKEWRMYT